MRKWRRDEPKQCQRVLVCIIYLSNIINSSFHFQNINENDVSEIINNLQKKSSCGIDGLNSIVIKSCSKSLLKPLTLIINQSLNTGIFPDKLKIAKVIPIYKEKDLDPNNLSNYRPISILPTLSKVFEKIVHNQVYNYFSNFNLFFNSQYGFRENHSTEFASIELVDRIYKLLDMNKNPIALFCDLSKAFDTLDHNILFKKLSYYGFSDIPCRWFSSYLSNRKQYVVLDDVSSSLKEITTGVPQGSILGPLLFLIYVNDLSSSLKTTSLMYADDTCLLIPFEITPSKNKSKIEIQNNEINKHLSSLFNWLCVNKLSLNIDKTKYMVFHFQQKRINGNQFPPLKINNKNVGRVENFLD